MVKISRRAYPRKSTSILFLKFCRNLILAFTIKIWVSFCHLFHFLLGSYSSVLKFKIGHRAETDTFLMIGEGNKVELLLAEDVTLRFNYSVKTIFNSYYTEV